MGFFENMGFFGNKEKKELEIKEETKEEEQVLICPYCEEELKTGDEYLSVSDGNAQTLKKLEVTERSLKNGSKFIVDSKQGISTIITDVAGVTPIPVKENK